MIAILAALALAAEPGFDGTVMKVVDGDTVRVQPAGERKWRTIKLIGIDAPTKATRDEDGQEPWGAQSQQFLSLLATREKVRVEFDIRRAVSQDDPGTTWGYVWLGDVLLNEAVLKAGHAVLATEVPNVKYVERLQAAAKVGRESQMGIWDREEPLTESPAEFAAKKKMPEKPSEDALARWEEGCVIGNRKSKVYHVAGGRYYDGMKESKDAAFFRTGDDAEKAGYKKSSR